MPMHRDFTSFRSYKHEVFTITQNKKALTSFYDKMYMVDSNNCTPYGFIQNKNGENKNNSLKTK